MKVYNHLQTRNSHNLIFPATIASVLALRRLSVVVAIPLRIATMTVVAHPHLEVTRLSIAITTATAPPLPVTHTIGVAATVPHHLHVAPVVRHSMTHTHLHHVAATAAKTLTALRRPVAMMTHMPPMAMADRVSDRPHHQELMVDMTSVRRRLDDTGNATPPPLFLSLGEWWSLLHSAYQTRPTHLVIIIINIVNVNVAIAFPFPGRVC